MRLSCQALMATPSPCGAATWQQTNSCRWVVGWSGIWQVQETCRSWARIIRDGFQVVTAVIPRPAANGQGQAQPSQQLSAKKVYEAGREGFGKVWQHGRRHGQVDEGRDENWGQRVILGSYLVDTRYL